MILTLLALWIALWVICTVFGLTFEVLAHIPDGWGEGVAVIAGLIVVIWWRVH